MASDGTRPDSGARVTLVMPVEHPTGSMLSAVTSLAMQPAPLLELIVVDGDATGATARAVAGSCGAIPAVRHLPAAGSGLGDLLNEGLAAARGELVGIVWPNGTYAAGYVEALARPCIDNPDLGGTYADWDLKKPAGAPAERQAAPPFDVATLQRRNYFGMCVLVRTDLVRRVGAFKPATRPLAWDLWRRMAAAATFKAVNLPLASFDSCPNRYVAGEAATVTVMPRVRPTVVLPTYNQISFLPLAVESVLAQTHADFEFIIVNDGSSDGTREWLDGIRDPRVSVIHQENARLPGALNTGMRAATGDLVTWISSDNWCAPTFLETLTGALAANPDAGFASSAYARIDESGRIIDIHRDPDYSFHNLMSMNPGTASFMYRRACHDTVGYYDESLEGAEDWDMWLRIHERYAHVYIPDVLYYYRYHPESMTSRKRELIEQSGRKTIANLYARNKHAFDIAAIYPSIARCANKPRAAMDACFDFGTSLLRSPFNPIDASIACLEEARRAAPHDRNVAVNLAIAYGRGERYGDAEQVIQACLRGMAGAAGDERLQRILTASRDRDHGAFVDMPVHVMDKSRSELFRVEAASRRVYTHYSGEAPRAASAGRSAV